MIVGDHEPDCHQPALFEPQQEVLPTRLALPISELYREHLPMTVSIDTNGDLYRPGGADHCCLSDPLIVGTDDKIWVRLIQFALCKRRQGII
jgi:hypothetical protein